MSQRSVAQLAIEVSIIFISGIIQGHRPTKAGSNHCANDRQELSLADPRRCGAHVTRAVDAAGAMDAENAPTALSSGDDFKIGQTTPCLRTARTYAILTAPAAGWFSNVR